MATVDLQKVALNYSVDKVSVMHVSPTASKLYSGQISTCEQWILCHHIINDFLNFQLP